MLLKKPDIKNQSWVEETEQQVHFKALLLMCYGCGSASGGDSTTAFCAEDELASEYIGLPFK